MNKAEQIRQSLKQKGVLVMPGVYDALSAKIAVRAGFEVIFITGYSVSATLLGEPDFGILTQTEVLSAAQRICSVAPTPVIVDADTGYGNAINVIRTVKELIRAGAAGMFLEDQVWPKRCGHMKGKQVIPLEEHLKKLTAAIDARGSDDLYIVARTDARQALGLKDAIERGIAFKKLGADEQGRDEGDRSERARSARRQHDRARSDAVDGTRGVERPGLSTYRLAVGTVVRVGESFERCLYRFKDEGDDTGNYEPAGFFR